MYFGIHVIARRVIFVDLALAQIAALGTVVGVAMGYEVGRDAGTLYFYSLALTGAGALVFAVTKMRIEKIPHEASIGIVYCVAFAATLLLLAKSPLGPSEIDRILKGEILFVSWPTVLNTALIYAAVGAFHFVFRRKFFALSFSGESQARMRHEVWWDFLFYLSFGFVVTSSVAIAGVFLVFSYLVIPSAGAILFTDRLGGRLAIGWIGAGAVSVAGVWLSHAVWDLPTSPLIVCLLAGALLAAVAVNGLTSAPSRRRTLMRLAVAGGGGAALVGGLFLFRKTGEDRFEHALHLLQARSAGERITGLRILADYPDRRAEWRARALPLLQDGDWQVRRDAMAVLAEDPDPGVAARVAANLRHPQPDVRIAAARALGRSANPAAGEALLAAAAQEEEIDVQLEMIDAALEKGLPGAVDLLFGLAADPLAKLDAYKRLVTHLAFDFPHAMHGGVETWWQSHRERIRELSAVLDDPQSTSEAKRAAFEELRGMSERGFEAADLDVVREWWTRNRASARWNPDRHRFEVQ